MKITRNINRLKYMHLLSREFLEKSYVLGKKSISNLARDAGIHEQTIRYYLEFYNIPIRTRLEQARISSKGPGYKYAMFLTRKFLLDEYVTKKKSIHMIADGCGLDYGTIVRYLSIYDIGRRTIKEQKAINHPPKEFSITSELKEFIDGLLLGDASIPLRSNGTAPRSLTQGCKHKEYLEYIKNRLLDEGITCSPILSHWIMDDRCKNKGYSESFLQTHSYKTFELFRARWYSQGRKIIPPDLKISRDLLLQLYLSDGNHYREILLCTNCFKGDEVLRLKRLMEEDLQITLRLVNSKDGFMLAIKKSACNTFLEYIGPCPINCYEYKWKDNESEEAKIRKNLNARLSYHRRQNAKKENICNTLSSFEKATL